MTSPALLEMREVVKRFGGTLALQRASFELRAGEIHALVGENGAGKSTLMNVLSGAILPDGGMIAVDGRPVAIESPRTAQKLGIGMIHQELRLVPAMTVAENIVLGHEPRFGRLPLVDRSGMARKARTALEPLGQELDLDAPVASLSAAQQQFVEIARALSHRVRILALDEPTATLTGAETAALFAVLRRLRSEGVGLIYISHRLEEVFEIADRITVMRDGVTVRVAAASELERADLVRAMVGRDVADAAPLESVVPGEVVLRLDAVRPRGQRPVSLILRAGEIVGLAGLVGSGRSELALAVFGARPPISGRVLLEGKTIAPRSPREAIEAGIGLLTEDRNRLGLIAGMTVRENVTLASLARLSRGPFVRRAEEAATVADLAERLRIRAASIEAHVSSLSGGNRQKVVLARWLTASTKVLIFDEPTAGVDVGAREEIYKLIRGLALEGRAILVISSDLTELLDLCDRIAVMSRGALTGQLTRAEATQERVMALATRDANA